MEHGVSSLGDVSCLYQAEIQAWDDMLLVIHYDRKDEVFWDLDKSKFFTTRSLYRFLAHGGIIDQQAKVFWKCKLPMKKKKVFVWQLCHKKLQSAMSLKKRGWKGSIKCSLCGDLEYTDHTFFGIARMIRC